MVWHRKSQFYGEIWSKRENSGVINTHKSLGVEEMHPKVLTSTGMGGARSYHMSPTSPGQTEKLWWRSLYILRFQPPHKEPPFLDCVRKKNPEEDPPLHHYHSSSSSSPSHLIVIVIVCNWDLLATGNLLRIFGLDVSNSTMFSILDLVITSE
jgi:hypothetical protein